MASVDLHFLVSHKKIGQSKVNATEWLENSNLKLASLRNLIEITEDILISDISKQRNQFVGSTKKCTFLQST